MHSVFSLRSITSTVGTTPLSRPTFRAACRRAGASRLSADLIDVLSAEASSSGVPVPAVRLYWLNHNYTYALTKSGNRTAGIERMDKALALQKHDPSITATTRCYQSLMNWLKAENRNDDAEAVHKRGCKIGVLKE
jgi:hypothetical protein